MGKAVVRSRLWLGIGLLLGCVAGCLPDIGVKPQPNAPAASTSAPNSAVGTDATQTPTAPATSSGATVVPATATPPASGPRIQLSAGVALPQSLPSGTTMGFSVDYRFIEGAPGTCVHLWVIVPSTGEPIATMVDLSSSGTLETFVPGLSPDSGPFQTQIVEECVGARRILSNLEPLR